LGADGDRLLAFFQQGYPFDLDLPNDLASTKVNGDEGLWIRIRIVENTFAADAPLPGQYGRHFARDQLRSRSWNCAAALADFRLGYLYQSPPDSPQVCLTHSDFQWQDYSEAIRWRGNSVEPLRRSPIAPPTCISDSIVLPAD
jgi:hypothetical protein